MNGRGRFWGPTLTRYLWREVLRVFALTLTAFVLLSLIADFFDRVDTFLKYDTPLDTVLRSLLFRAPQVMTQVAPIALLAGVLIGLGLMARHREFIALRACGVSASQILLPLLVLAALVAGATFAWNETVVPSAARRWHEIWNRDVKKNRKVSVFAGRQIWYRGRAGFYSIGRASLRRQALLDLTVYQLDDSFRPLRIVTARQALWDGREWRLDDARTHELVPDGIRVQEGTPAGFRLPETLEDFTVAELDPEAFGYRMLRQQIQSLRSKGVDTSESWVDLHLKLALPAAAIIMMLVGVPLAIRGTHATSLPAAAAVGFAVGFSYFVLVAFARALGQNGALPPVVAAWAGNAVFAILGAYLTLGAD